MIPVPVRVPDPPLALLAELTHRCPPACPYCANPLDLEPASAELDTVGWLRVLDEAAVGPAPEFVYRRHRTPALMT